MVNTWISVAYVANVPFSGSFSIGGSIGINLILAVLLHELHWLTRRTRSVVETRYFNFIFSIV